MGTFIPETQVINSTQSLRKFELFYSNNRNIPM